MASEIVIQKDFGLPRPRSIRLMVAQIETFGPDWELRDGLYFQRNVRQVQKTVEQFLTLAKQHTVETIVLPELSVPVECIDTIQAWSKETAGTAIAGSHYHCSDGTYTSRCPVVIAGEVLFTEKIIPSPIERSPVPKQGLSPGKHITLFRNTPIGNFAVLICSDYLDSQMRQMALEHGLDFLFVPAFQQRSDQYHSRMSSDCEESHQGVFIAYSNMRCEELGDGRSALFGVMDSLFFDKLKEARLTNGHPTHKICELSGGQRYAIFDVDINSKRAMLPRTVHSRPNVSVLEIDKPEFDVTSKFAAKIAHDDERYRQIEKYFVPPKEFSAILDRLEKSKLVFIIGDPGIGKTYTAAMILKTYFDKGYEPIWFTGLEREERRVQRLTLENFEPLDRQIIYFEDPFGRLTFEKRDTIFSIFAPLTDRLIDVDARVVITSRKEIFEQFSRESLTSRELSGFVEEMNVVKPSYPPEAMKLILNKLAAGRCAWYPDSECRAVVETAIAKGELNTPLGMRDLVYSTERVTRVQHLQSAIRRREEEEVLSFTREVLACDPPTKLLLAFVYLFGYCGQSFMLSPFETLSNSLDLGDQAMQQGMFTHILRSQLGYRIEQWGKVRTSLRFTHPAYEEAVAEAGMQDATMERMLSSIIECVYEQDFPACLKAVIRQSSTHPKMTAQLLASLAELVNQSGDLSRRINLATQVVILYNNMVNDKMELPQLRATATSLVDPSTLANEISSTPNTTQLARGLRLASHYDSRIGKSNGSLIAPLINWDKVFSNVRRFSSIHNLLDLFEWIQIMIPKRATTFINSLSPAAMVRRTGSIPVSDTKRAKRLFAGTNLYETLMMMDGDLFGGARNWRRMIIEKSSTIPECPAIVIDANLAAILRRSVTLPGSPRVSVLPAGILEVIGDFREADAISILDQNKCRIGIGVVEYESHDVRDIMGHHTSQIPELIGKYYGPGVMRCSLWAVLPIS
ncbi:MAG: PUA domain-containing protein [Planctomycetota bacterium]